MFDLSFSPEFFVGPHDLELDWRGSKPTTVYQALMSMPSDEWKAMSRDVFEQDDVDPLAALDKIRETNTCNQLHSPITVYIDPDGQYTIDVY